ncbi:hypothetical protein [Paenibacillus hexagrammi]|uniref:DUF998 domain-containing protein n=1 Tax=Paenibacillus hexagrammi TaxID=2908839 RepID=A0ABY3SLB0_9BACL|nr:hypothetical protein [Paenibacillus sp. YPD9-1]UJF33871.1 hypothetical protein L0M14_00985 [Paenibacillus sp. YPD9-1]
MRSFIQLLMAFLTYYSMIVVTFTLFQIPVTRSYYLADGRIVQDRLYGLKILLMSFSVGFIFFYTKLILHSPLFLIITVISFMTFIILIRNYPILYALIVAGTGYLLSGTVDMAVLLTGSMLHITSDELMNMNLVHYATAHMIVAIILLALAYVVRITGFRFSFINSRFRGRTAFKGYYFIWMIFFICTLVSLQVAWFGLNLNLSKLYIVIFIGMFVFMLAALIYAYVRNREHVKARYSIAEDVSPEIAGQIRKILEMKEEGKDDRT